MFCFKLLHRDQLSLSSSAPQAEKLTKEDKTEHSFFSSGVASQNLMAAFKCFLSLGLAVFLGLVYSKPDGYWAGLPVAISLASGREATFKVANLKAQGTVLGTVYAVLVCSAFSPNLPLRFMSLLPWFVFTNFLRKSKMYGQAGGLSAIIGAILILGRKGFGGPKEFAIARIVETFIGLFCSVMVDIMFQPTRASTLAKAELVKSISAFHHCVAGLNIRDTNNNEQKRLKNCVEELSKCIGQAEAEPNFWFLAFNSASYNRLKLSLTRTEDYLLFKSHAIQLLEAQATSETWQEVEINLANDVKQFADGVSCLVKCFEDVMKLKSVTELEKSNSIADIEAGKAPKLKKLLAVQECEENDELGVIVKRYLEHVNEGLEKLGGAEAAVRREVMLCLGTVGFCMDGLAREIREIEKGVKEIVQRENPTSHVDLYQIFCKMNTGEQNCE